MHGRLSGTGRLHDNKQIDWYTRVGTETINFRIVMAIHTGQYASFDIISFCALLNQLNGDNRVLFLPKAGCAFLIVATLQCFLLTSSTTVKNHTKVMM